MALGVTALLLTAGAGVRTFQPEAAAVAWQSEGAPADTLMGGDALAALIAGVDSALEVERTRAKPLDPGEKIDLNRATADELQRLPRVGAGLAERIVAHRREVGGFRSLDDFDAVPGVGPALLESLREHLEIRGARPRASRPLAGGSSRPARGTSARAPAAALDLNRATAAELERLPGIGPALAARIVDNRDSVGRFGAVDELLRVPGIGPAKLDRLRPQVRVKP